MAEKQDDIIICRCQEVTRQEILQAIADGAVTVDGVKKRTRAGMGLCQGKTCERPDCQNCGGADGEAAGGDSAANVPRAGPAGCHHLVFAGG